MGEIWLCYVQYHFAFFFFFLFLFFLGFDIRVIICLFKDSPWRGCWFGFRVSWLQDDTTYRAFLTNMTCTRVVGKGRMLGLF